MHGIEQRGIERRGNVQRGIVTKPAPRPLSRGEGTPLPMGVGHFPLDISPGRFPFLQHPDIPPFPWQCVSV